ncbi:hypothetical protein [Streptomyces sp. NPDC087300]|uniref:hypothetical protein n=1 Tax=Streptomyces sp. NPDC087300 TaxID=3365780 RepID=UPI0038030B19
MTGLRRACGRPGPPGDRPHRAGDRTTQPPAPPHPDSSPATGGTTRAVVRGPYQTGTTARVVVRVCPGAGYAFDGRVDDWALDGRPHFNKGRGGSAAWRAEGGKVTARRAQ